VLEGTIDSALFATFLEEICSKLRDDPDYKDRAIVFLLDNARVHKVDICHALSAKFGVSFIYNAEYSPWINPIEKYFQLLKQDLRKLHPATKISITKGIAKFAQSYTFERLTSVWRYTIRRWIETIEFGTVLAP